MPAERWSAVDGRRLDFKALEEARRINLNVVFLGQFQRLMGGVFGDVVVVTDGPKLSKSFFKCGRSFFFAKVIEDNSSVSKKNTNPTNDLGGVGGVKCQHQGGVGWIGMDGGRDLGVGLWRGVEC